jgi:hypothetical protein
MCNYWITQLFTEPQFVAVILFLNRVLKNTAIWKKSAAAGHNSLLLVSQDVRTREVQ